MLATTAAASATSIAQLPGGTSLCQQSPATSISSRTLAALLLLNLQQKQHQPPLLITSLGGYQQVVWSWGVMTRFLIWVLCMSHQAIVLCSNAEQHQHWGKAPVQACIACAGTIWFQWSLQAR
jgi:hypothetical protein